MGRQRELLGLEGPVRALAFAPDGATVLAVPRYQRRIGDPGTLVFWRPDTQGPPERLPWSNGIQAIAFEAGGGWLAVADEERSVEVFQAGATRQNALLRTANTITALAFAPAGAGPWPSAPAARSISGT
jgi:hypothetical protein